MKNLFTNLFKELQKVEAEVMVQMEAKDRRIAELESQVNQFMQMMKDVQMINVDVIQPVEEAQPTIMETIASRQVAPVIEVPVVTVPMQEPVMVHDELDDIDSEGSSESVEESTQSIDPFANVPVKETTQQEEEATTMPQGNPFANVPVKEDKGVEVPTNNPFASVPVKEEEAPAIQTITLADAKPQHKKKAGRGEVGTIVYNVLGSQVTYVKKSMVLNTIKNEELAQNTKAFNKLFVIPKEMKNSEVKEHKAIVHHKKLMTQFLRDYAMEIAAMNRIPYVLGDAGAAYLVTGTRMNMLNQPRLVARNDEERNLVVANYQKGSVDGAHLNMMFQTIKPFIDMFGINIRNVVTSRDVSDNEAAILGTAIIFSRLAIADANVSTSYRYASCYNKVEEDILVKAEVEKVSGFKLYN